MAIIKPPITHDHLYNQLLYYEDRFLHKEIPINLVQWDVQVIFDELKIPCVAETVQRDNALPDRVLVTGGYDVQNEEFQLPVYDMQLIFQHDRPFLFTKQATTALFEDMTQVLIHEMIHREQGRKREFELRHLDPTWDKHGRTAEYYAHTDEITAFAYNFAYRLLARLKTRENALKMLKTLQGSEALEIDPHLMCYINKFSGIPKGRRVLNRLFRQIVEYIEVIDERQDV